MMSATRSDASSHDVGAPSKVVPDFVAMCWRSSAAIAATRAGRAAVKRAGRFAAPRAAAIASAKSTAVVAIAPATAWRTSSGDMRSAPTMRMGSNPTDAFATAASPNPSLASCCASAATIVAFVVASTPATPLRRSSASALHACRDVAMPGATIAAAATSGAPPASAGGASLGIATSHCATCEPLGAMPSAASSARALPTVAACAFVSLLRRSRTADHTSPAAAFVLFRRSVESSPTPKSTASAAARSGQPAQPATIAATSPTVVAMPAFAMPSDATAACAA